jgi:hypothetical protein
MPGFGSEMALEALTVIDLSPKRFIISITRRPSEFDLMGSLPADHLPILC